MGKQWRPRVLSFIILATACLVGIHGVRSGQTLLRDDRASLRSDVRRSDLNVIIITLDTTRADHVGAYGLQSISTPNLDRLAHEGVLFEQTETVAPLTLPAHVSLFTGRFPPAHGVRDNAGYVLDAHQVSLAGLLRGRGYRTGAFVASAVLASDRGLNRGFDTYHDEVAPSESAAIAAGARRRADAVADQAIEWIADVGSARFFAWLHFYDAHRPYDVPEPYRTQYAGRPYDGAIAFMDDQIGRVVTFLEKQRLLRRTIIVVMGDHGESLGDHGEISHAVFVYESVIRVPLIIHAPFAHLHGRIIDDVTRTVDVMPTLLDLLEIRPPATIDGTSLVPLMIGAVRALGLEAYSESLYPLHRYGWSDLHALRAGRYKVIAAPHPELYDLQTDPFESHNEYPTRKALGDRMLARLRAFERRSSSALAERSRVDVDPSTAGRLAALGYINRSGFVRPTGNGSALPDPKDQIRSLDPEGRP